MSQTVHNYTYIHGYFKSLENVKARIKKAFPGLTFLGIWEVSMETGLPEILPGQGTLYESREAKCFVANAEESTWLLRTEEL